MGESVKNIKKQLKLRYVNQISNITVNTGGKQTV